MSSFTHKFTFPLRLEGGRLVAELDGRCRVGYLAGSPTTYHDPGNEAEIEDISDIEFDEISAKGESWVPADEYLAAKVEAWLRGECMDDLIAKASEEPEDDDRADYKYDEARDRRLTEGTIDMGRALFGGV